ncbi:ligase-associated DNA damage response endonuclease PdeM [Yoonia sp. BS5-3]|uniref:Ligase-associated DNA damage response endonuclease PdeM n=1 Tax=Yoonia phaeophyticola TaxID=3137369 RepID=A0ABZ2V3G8_9RHOB
MNEHDFTLADTQCRALPSGALFLPAHGLLCVSDLHLGKSDRIARRSGVMLPPYEVRQTLEKLQSDVHAISPKMVICIGDSFDDLQAIDSLHDDMRLLLTGLQAGREWIWIEGNHDPGPVDLGGTHLAELTVGTLCFRHIATAQSGEVSGHYHPKHRVTGRSRPAFIYDKARVVLPAYGAYTGGLSSDAPVLDQLFDKNAIAVLTGHKAVATPLRKFPQRAS